MSAFKSKDFWAGAMFLGFGLLFVVAARNYSFGTAVSMGPSYFPTVLGSLLAGLGLVVGGRSFLGAIEEVGHFALRPIVLVVIAVVLFSVSLRHLGLVVATLFLILIGALAAGSQFRWREVAIVYLALVAFAVGVFHYALGIPVPLWPGFLAG